MTDQANTFNLRKISAIKDSIVRKIKELREELSDNRFTHFNVWEVAEGRDYESEICDIFVANECRLAEISRLESLLVYLRGEVANINAKAGVNFILAERNVILSRIAFLKGFIKNIDITKTNEQIHKMLSFSIGREDRYGGSIERSVVGVYSERQVEEFKNDIARSELFLRDISDKLIAININNTITLNDEQMSVLVDNGIV